MVAPEDGPPLPWSVVAAASTAVLIVGLFDTDAVGGCCCGLAVAAFECTEFCLARDDGGRPVVDGAGEARAPLIASSGKFPSTGELATDGEAAAVVRLDCMACVSLLFSGQNVPSKSTNLFFD